MKETTWKILAITSWILLLVLVALAIWGMIDAKKEVERTTLCYYDICEEYPDALVESNVCFCYDYDVLGNLMIAKTEIMR